MRTWLNCRGCQSLVDIVVHPDRLFLTGPSLAENLPARMKVLLLRLFSVSLFHSLFRGPRDRVNAPATVHSETLRSVVSRSAGDHGSIGREPFADERR